MTVSAQSVSHKLNHCSSVRYHLEFASQWLQDSAVTEICVNRPFEIWCERQGIWEKHSDSQLSLAYLHSLATAVAKFSDNNISDTCPILSATLPDGERVQIVVPPACENNTVAVTIRKPSLKLHYLADYQNQGFFAHIRPVVEELTADERELIQLKEQRDYCNFLKRAVQLEKVIVVAGETGSGKTTFMKALLQEISCQQRIITIEDVPELFLPNHPNHVHLFYPSEAKEEENASVTASTLLKSCLRMKPSRILLAELRGGETFDFINVAASGHGGSITSCHAGSAALTFERLALMILQNRQGRTLSHSVIQRLLYLVVDVIVHIHNSPLEGYGRHITEVWFDPMKKRSSELTL
ncbi:MAG: P-type DNA transfer ATPase VirB11 (plasmid) [Candidatus Symbiodolus clandestinus]